MNTTERTTSTAKHCDEVSDWRQQDVINYYRAAGADYAAWSKNLHMHLGYYRPGLNPFRLEDMLDEMPKQLFLRLQLPRQSSGTVLDLGCGVGASLRIGCRLYPQLSWQGATIVPEQQACCQAMSQQSEQYSTIKVDVEDYERLSRADESVDFVYALESMSHATGEAKALLVAEMYRILKPGGRFAIADGFLKKPVKELSPLLRRCHDELCRGWALPVMGVVPMVTDSLHNVGFSDIKTEDVSWRVAPSVAHIPYITTKFLFQQSRQNENLGIERRNHLKSCVLTGITGLARSSFIYCFVSGTKPL